MLNRGRRYRGLAESPAAGLLVGAVAGVALGSAVVLVRHRSRQSPRRAIDPPVSPDGAADDRAPDLGSAADLPATPATLTKRTWRGVLVRTGKQAVEDKLTTWAAALTYYAVLSLFPALLVSLAVLRLSGQHATTMIINNVTDLAPGPARTIVVQALDELRQGQASAAGVLAVVGLLGGFWSASGYIGAFMEAANSIYDVPEGRPLWKTVPIRLGITIASGIVVLIAVLAVVFTGNLARRAGALIGLEAATVRTWDIVKWPVIAVVISLLFALLYWAAPNAKQGGFAWITPGSALAVLVWIAASAGFALYVTNFSSYNKTYGSLATVIIFLVWLWISNLAVLFGAEFDAELHRGRAIQSGQDPKQEPYLPLRDHRGVADAAPQPL